MSHTAYATAAGKQHQTPQSEKADASQVPNNAGGFTFTVSPWQQLDRFLILGTEGGTYYVAEQKLTKEGAANVCDLIKEDGTRVVARITEISDAGRAVKNDPAIFALALCIAEGDKDTRKSAYAALTKVCRIGTHLFHLADYVTKLRGRGWGRGLRKAFARFYNCRPIPALSNQLFKYQQRDGWSHKDVMNLCHPWAAYHGKKDADAENRNFLFRAVTKDGLVPSADQFSFTRACKAVHATDCKARDMARLIKEHALPREVLPTEALNNPEVWRALLPEMPITALIRNLGNLTKHGVISPLSDDSNLVCAKLTDAAALKEGRVHPISILLALKIYAQGKGMKGTGEWSPVTQVLDALDTAFYMAFKNVEPTGKNFYIGLDVSGSMDSDVAGMPLSAREATGSIAMTIARTEANHHIAGFTSTGSGSGGRWGGSDSGLTDVNISAKERLDDVARKLAALPMGGTDCSLPMQDALKRKIPVDVFIVMTDNETWAGEIHPHEALEKYRREMKRDAKLLVLDTAATPFSIAKPGCPYMLDVAGFDSAIPEVIRQFALL